MANIAHHAVFVLSARRNNISALTPYAKPIIKSGGKWEIAGLAMT
jgi:hypothetical protein